METRAKARAEARTPAAANTSAAAVHRPALVAVAHGSRDPWALRTVRALLDEVRARRPGLDVRLGHIELNEPLLSDTLADVSGQAVLVPLLLGRGHHVKRDLPDALAGAPHVKGVVAAPLGPDPLLAEALYARLAEAGWQEGDQAVVLAAAGSRDPDSAVDTARTAALLSVRLGGVPVLPAYASGGGPTVHEAVAALTGRGLRQIAVASYFTAPGRFATQTANAAPWIVSAPLGAHDAMARLVLRRYDEAAGAAEGVIGPAAAAEEHGGGRSRRLLAAGRS